jgi:amidase
MNDLDRRTFLTLAGMAAAASFARPLELFGQAPLELEELTISAMQAGMRGGTLTARRLAELYLARIDAMDKQGPAVNAMIELNPDALAIADTLDAERKAGRTRGAMHGISIVIKDNIDTADRMHTTAGSLACGSSTGTGAAVAANFAAVGVGTETDGSVVCPSSSNGLVGLKPTVGLVSRSGIIPISHSQDTAGPMARSVTDAAILLGAMTGIDSLDEVTAKSRGHVSADYTQFLDANGLRGARIGVARQAFGFSDAVDALMTTSIEAIRNLGATIVDPANLETQGKFDASEFEVLLYEFKADLNAYLANLGPNVKPRTLADLIKFNEEHRQQEMPWFGQEIFEQAQKKGPLTDADYVKALAKNHRLARAEGIDATMKKHKLDAVIAPTGGPAWTTDLINGDHYTGGYSSASAVAGYPHITVPAGLVQGLPVGLSFFGGAWSEGTLLKFAFAFEQTTKARQAPRFLANV